MDTAKRSGAGRDVAHHLDKPGSGHIDRFVDFWGLPDFSTRYVAGVRPDYGHDHHNNIALPMMKPPTVPPVKGITRAEFLERQPEHLREFYAAIFNALSPQFVLSRGGIAHKPGHGQMSVPFCSPFRVKALVEASKSKHWSRVVELLNPKGELVECIIAEGSLTGRPRDAIATLSNHGLQVHNEYQIRVILDLVRNWPVPSEAYLTLIDRVGWTQGRDAFILTSGRVITRKGEAPRYRFGGEPSGKEIGSLALWRDHIGALAVGNTNMVFGISLGFSTALFEFTELDTTIYHLFAKTSEGKTRTLRSALTVWPRIGDKEKTWAGTINGLEAEIAASHNILLGLDELRGDATPDLPALIYRFANGASKARGRKEGGAKERETWRTAVLSTGEISFVDVVSKLGGMPTGGQGVRMLDIPATGHYGVFDALHGSETSDDFVARLDKAIRRAWGAAGAAFVEKLLELEEETLRDILETDVRRYEVALQRHLGVIPGDEKTSEIRRVLRSFALVATAGEWASDWGLTGWETGAAYAAAQTIAERWLHGRGRIPFEQTQTLKKVQEYLTINEQRFVPLSDAGSRREHGAGEPVYQDDTFIYLLPAALAHMARELAITETEKVLEALTEGGFLERGGEDKSRQHRLPSVVPNRPRAYRIRRTILNFEGKDDTPSHHPKETEE